MSLVNRIKGLYNQFRDRKLVKWLKDRGIYATCIPATQCPCCKNKLDIAAHSPQDKPKAKDIGVCYHCGGILEVCKDGGLIAITEESWNSMPSYAKEETLRVSKMTANARKLGHSKSDVEELFGL